jgi:hypothetical protein
MRAYEFLTEASAPKKLGRAFNHLEDLVFFYGSKGTIEALEHLKDFNTEQGSSSIRMKWDGNPQIYWGRDDQGRFIPPHGHNQWSRGDLPANSNDVSKFIMGTGKATTPDEVKARQAFANKFASLSAMFEKATPKNFKGYVYADALFLDKPQLVNGVYTFCPNPKSKTCYHVRADSDLGKRIAQAKVMVVGHAMFPEHGMPDSEQVPLTDFDAFNNNPEVIVLGPIYNTAPVSIDETEINQVESMVEKYGRDIDQFLEGAAGLSDLRNIMYTYVNQTAKAKQLDQLGVEHFFAWAANKVSAGKQAKIKALAEQYPNAMPEMFTVIKQVQALKNSVINQIEAGPKAEIWDTEGEGRVRYADKNKQFGNVKLVPRHRWTPA